MLVESNSIGAVCEQIKANEMTEDLQCLRSLLKFSFALLKQSTNKEIYNSTEVIFAESFLLANFILLFFSSKFSTVFDRAIAFI